MMQNAMKSMRLVQMQARAFSYNYSSSSHPKVWMTVAKDGHSAGRMVFELYSSHTPSIAENFAAFATGEASNQRSFAGSSFCCGWSGLGVVGGDFCGHNLGANDMRVEDENLEMRHHKRGLVTMFNEGPNSNGSRFMITFGEANNLDGYNNVVGELVDGESVLSELESSVNREG